ncbi:alginate O-acetyltransferase [Pseudomonas alcaligenes]|uniref:Probable alginate O-acetylase AlgJ n=1 Tax=Aquipseudomonas alcaligenes TaxID=43263 RepID=A0ABR7S0I1_AQUAC|nr:alginate O-acetyltransferase [Pseudomonas alcaligenes]MBC9250534.1 alginate O-acetyltransferase [Pseudomonas alcaligenes]
MSRTANILYSLTFLALLLGLSLASLPALLSFSAAGETPLLNGKLAHAIEKHYDKQFPLKEIGTNAWAALEYSLFGEGRPGVVVGREDWLFTDEEFKPASNPQQLQDNWALIAAVQQEFKRRHIELVLALLPAKARLYPEQIATDKPVAAQQQLYSQARQMMQAQHLLGPDLLLALQQAKASEAVFLRTDTHWTPYGAEVAAKDLAAYLAARGDWPRGEQQFVTRTAASQSHKGDLLSFLPLAPYFSALQPPAESLQPRHTESLETAGDSGDALFADSQPQVALVGTSYSANPKWNFAGALKQALGSDLLNYAEDGHGPLVPMLRLLQRDGAETADLRLVIWEFPERYLMLPSDLSEFDSAWLDRLRASEQLATRDSVKPVTAP